MTYGDLKVRNLIWNTGSGDNAVVLADVAFKNNPTFTGTVTVPTAPASDVSTKAASTAFVDAYYATKSGASFTGAVTGTDLTLSGNLVVNGTTTTVNTENLEVKDKNIIVGKVSTPSDTTADGGGITLLGSSNKTFNWVNATDAWTSSEHIYLGDNKKLLLGVGAGGVQDLSVYSNGSEGILETQSGGTIKIKTATGSSSTDTFATFSGPASQIDFHKSVLFIGNSKNIVWDNPNDSFYFTDNAKIRLGAGSGVAGDLLLYSDGTTAKFDGNIDFNGTLQFSDGSDVSALVWNQSTNNLEFKDDNKLTFGDGNDLQIWHENTVGSHINNSYLKLYIDSYTGVVLEHNTAAKLETTATGVNVIGAITVNGTALSAAPEITATAHGTVTAEKAVMVRSDGKVETVANVAASNGSFTNMNQFNNQGKLTRIASNNNGQYVLLEDTNVSNGLQATVLTVSGTTVTKNSATSITTTCSQTANDDRFDISYDSTADKFVVVYIHSSTANVQAKTVTISGTGTSASVSQGTEITIGSSVSEFCRVAYDPDQDKTALIADVGNDGFAWALTVSGTNLSASSAVQIDEGKTPFQQPNMCYDNKNKKFQILWRQSNSGIIRPQTLTWDAGNARYNGYSGTPPILWSNGYEGPISMAHIKDTDGYVCHYKRGDNLMYARLITCNSSGSTITAGSETQVHASYAYRSGDMKHDSLNEKMMLISRGTDGFIDYKVLSYNVTNRTVATDSTTILANSSTNPASSSFVAEGINAAFDTTNNIFLCSFAKSQVGSYSTNQVMAIQRPSTTLNATRFIGFASSTVTDGNTATVKVASNTSTQSSLTPAIKYYVQGDGTVGATASNPSVEAGVALSSTKLLIKG